MKRVLVSVFALGILFITSVSFTSVNVDSDPIGKWSFSAPDAPYGYTTGKIEVTFKDSKYSASISFTNMEYKFAGENVTFKENELVFSIFLEGDDIMIVMTIEEDKMSGKALSYDGEVQISATRDKE
jgi:hypothetical protein